MLDGNKSDFQRWTTYHVIPDPKGTVKCTAFAVIITTINSGSRLQFFVSKALSKSIESLERGHFIDECVFVVTLDKSSFLDPLECSLEIRTSLIFERVLSLYLPSLETCNE